MDVRDRILKLEIRYNEDTARPLDVYEQSEHKEADLISCQLTDAYTQRA